MADDDAPGERPPRTFTVSVTAMADLTVDEIWPLGNAPDDPSPDDVIAALKRSERVPHKVIAGLCMEEETSVSVTATGLEAATWHD